MALRVWRNTDPGLPTLPERLGGILPETLEIGTSRKTKDEDGYGLLEQLVFIIHFLSRI